MKTIDRSIVRQLLRPDKFSHKGQNGKLMVIGGSDLFHGASLWALKTASRIVDMVFYLSIPKNQEYADWLNPQLYDFINISFKDMDSYIKEADAILLGPGMKREKKGREAERPRGNKITSQFSDLSFENTYEVVDYLLHKYPQKRWILDAGALQVMEAGWLKELKEVIVTPHQGEYEKLFKIKSDIFDMRPHSKYDTYYKENTSKQYDNLVLSFAKEYGCTIVLKGPQDIICNPDHCLINKTGNEGMTKGGTGDVLAGLIAALACKNDLFLAAAAGTYINGLAGDELYGEVGTFYNASDLCERIPRVLGKLIGNKENRN